MNEIKCPKCGEIFQVDESGYASILQQVRDVEFNKEIERNRRDFSEKQENALALARMEQEKSHNEELSKKEAAIREKEHEIEQLKAQLDKAETEKKLAITEAVTEKEKELAEKGNEITKLYGDIELQKKESDIREKNLIEKHKGELQLREEEIERLKDFKAKQSTKMVGESLEQYCQNQFNSIRMTAFPNAYFEKDNEVSSSGSKGDFIFKESVDGTEFISIMFEMKNEMDTTATKKKNEDFFKELDKDRKEKHCEYAVLVTLLEGDNDFYNNGIVDVSYKYPKMYVVRPQFFIPLISLLRNAALNSLQYQKELAIVKSQQMDLTNFENNLEEFKSSFYTSFSHAKERYDDAIKGIDDTINKLQKIRDALVKSEDHLSTANRKIEDVSVKKLTKNAPSVRQALEDMQAKK